MASTAYARAGVAGYPAGGAHFSPAPLAGGVATKGIVPGGAGHGVGVATAPTGREMQQSALKDASMPQRGGVEDGTATAAATLAGKQSPPNQDSRGAFNTCSSLLRGVPPMEVLVRYERSWSIQDALDQHGALVEQREVLTEIGRNRLRVRQTQLSFAELEVEDALEMAKGISPAFAVDTQRVVQMASRLRATVRDLRLAIRLRAMEQGAVDKHLALADAEIETSRMEMTCMKEAIDDRSLTVATDETQPAPKVPVDESGKTLKQRYFYCTNCKVGGHGQRFCEYLVERPDWRIYPNQKWFEDEKHNEYHCPLGKKLVDFADESHFSRVSMYLRGRAWLEEKTKVLELEPSLMPDTYILQNGTWKDRAPPPDSEVSNLPWFVKEADRNWGTSVHVCQKPSECLSLVKPDATYVVQQHIKDPLTMKDGRKCHIKFYVLLIGLEDAVRWNLYCYKNGYLSISPNVWSPTDISKETQVTIIRTERIGDWEEWEAAYPKCKAAVAKVMERAVVSGKLEGRIGKRQFEILSADFVLDRHGGAWLLEFNMSPVLKDPRDAPKVNDADMIRGALHVVVPHDGGSQGEWDFAGEFVGPPPQPRKPPATHAQETDPAKESEQGVAPPREASRPTDAASRPTDEASRPPTDAPSGNLPCSEESGQ